MTSSANIAEPNTAVNVVFNAVNARSAGTYSVTRLMIDQLSQSKDNDVRHYLFFVPDIDLYKDVANAASVTIIRIKIGGGILGAIRRLRFEMGQLPSSVKRLRPLCVFILGNYSLATLSAPKSVLVRHPYLLELGTDHTVELSMRRKIEEIARKYLFRRTIRCTDNWVVQSTVMREKLALRWQIDPSKIMVTPNPVDDEVLAARTWVRPERRRSSWQLIYPSRYYEHKNHEALLDFALRRKAFLSEHSIQILITVNVSQGANSAMGRRFLSIGSDVVMNIGEVAKDELYRRYRDADAMIFPSESETFGNGLIEGACFSLPLLVADRPYAHIFGNDMVTLFEPGDDDSLLAALKYMMRNYDRCVAKSREISGQAISTSQWVENALPSSCRTQTTAALN